RGDLAFYERQIPRQAENTPRQADPGAHSPRLPPERSVAGRPALLCGPARDRATLFHLRAAARAPSPLAAPAGTPRARPVHGVGMPRGADRANVPEGAGRRERYFARRARGCRDQCEEASPRPAHPPGALRPFFLDHEDLRPDCHEPTLRRCARNAKAAARVRLRAAPCARSGRGRPGPRPEDHFTSETAPESRRLARL